MRADWPTTRQFPRTLEDAFRGPDYACSVIRTRPTLGWKLREFVSVYRAYRLGNSRRYAAWIAFEIAFKGAAF